MFRKYAFCEILRRGFSFYANKIRNMYENVAFYGFKYTFCYFMRINSYIKRCFIINKVFLIVVLSCLFDNVVVLPHLV